jgi:hypothetical protein
VNPIRNISSGSVSPLAVFVTDSNDIYTDNGYSNYRVDKWSLNSTTSVPVMYVCKPCFAIFVDTANYLYCSMADLHQVLSTSLDTRVNMWNTVAGNPSAGSTPTALNNPHGIFITANFDMYVADCGNDRIQKFRLGNLNGTTVVASTVPNTFSLDCPRDIILDADGYMFISDSHNHRIIGSGPYGFRCIFSCNGYGGSVSQLYYPRAISFDNLGNIFIVDHSNSRLQKVSFIASSCSKSVRI